MNIEFSDHTVFYPRRVRQVEARLGQFSARGKNKTEAKAALLAQVAKQGEHLYERRYLIGAKATFVLYYCCGWGYDIVPMEQDADAQFARYSYVGYGDDDTTMESAFDRMRRHFNDFHGAPGAWSPEN